MSLTLWIVLGLTFSWLFSCQANDEFRTSHQDKLQATLRQYFCNYLCAEAHRQDCWRAPSRVWSEKWLSVSNEWCSCLDCCFAHALLHVSCGSTIGPLVSKIGLRTVDIGCPMLSMHSVRETAGSGDVSTLIKLFVTFFESFAEVDDLSNNWSILWQSNSKQTSQTYCVLSSWKETNYFCILRHISLSQITGFDSRSPYRQTNMSPFTRPELVVRVSNTLFFASSFFSLPVDNRVADEYDCCFGT